MDKNSVKNITPEFQKRFNEVLSYFKVFARQNNGEIVYANVVSGDNGENIIVDVEDICILSKDIANFRSVVDLLDGIQFISIPQREVLRIIVSVKS